MSMRTLRPRPAGAPTTRIWTRRANGCVHCAVLVMLLSLATKTFAFQTLVTVSNDARIRAPILPTSAPEIPASAGLAVSRQRRRRPYKLLTRTLLQANNNNREPETTTQEPSSNNNNNKKGGVLDFLLHPYESKIPPELEKDIYAAEANTPAARDRGQRVAFYAVLAFGGILCAFFNGFLTELRADVVANGGGGDPLAVLDDAGFGWVTSNFLLSFLFTNKIGGVLCLLGGGAAGLLAEAEYDTRRINAEEIFAEMQRRRAEKERGSGRNKKKKAAPPQKASKKKRLSGKEQKRLSALSEVVVPNGDDDNTATTKTSTPAKTKSAEPVEVEPVAAAAEVSDPKKPPEGILGKIQSFYEKADNMAASQALLLNKKLEDEGLIEKITDESGFNVIGKEEAAKRQQQQTKKEAPSSSETSGKEQ